VTPGQGPPPGSPQPNRDRFLAGIAERIAPGRVQALYLFSSMRQGPVETGVAVIAVDRVPDVQAVAEPAQSEPAQPEQVTAQPRHRERPVVLTARYKHTLRGTDRGKWELEIFEQADAPLATVEAVVQGVQRRLAEPTDPELLDGEALRVAAADGLWTPPAR
jgi:hypothetical protein